MKDLREGNEAVDTRRMLISSVSGYLVFFINLLIVGSAGVYNFVVTEREVDTVSENFRKQEAIGMDTEIAALLHRAWMMGNAYAKTELTGGNMRSGITVIPPMARSFSNFTETAVLHQRNFASLHKPVWMKRAALNRSERTYTPVVAWTDIIFLQEHGEYGNVDTCDHVIQMISLGPYDEYDELWEVDLQFEDAAHENSERAVYWFNYTSQTFQDEPDHWVDPWSCQYFAEDGPLSDSNAVALPEFSNFTWVVWHSGGFMGEVLFGFVPVIEATGIAGVAGLILPLLETINPILEHVISEGGDLTKGGHAVLFTADGYILGTSDDVISEQESTIENLESDNEIAVVLRQVRDEWGAECPSEQHLFVFGETLVDVTPLYPEEFGLPPWSGRWCGLITVPRTNLYMHLDTVVDNGVILGIVALVSLVVSCVFLMTSLGFAIRAQRLVWDEKREEDMRRIKAATRSVNSLDCPMSMMRAEDFLAMKSWECHEVWRDRGKLLMLDTLDEVRLFRQENCILFVSHQWLGFKVPDTEDLVQMRAMQRAVKLARADSDKSVYVWCDYISVAQRHAGSQRIAVLSLPVYVSVVDRFIIVAPTSNHRDNGELCDVSTYSKRGWCRMEMLAKACSSGLSEMYVCGGDGESLVALAEMEETCLSFKVFEGNFSREADKEVLVEPILGLYSLMLHQAEQDASQVHHILAEINGDKNTFFPQKYVLDIDGERRVRRPLFGNLVALVERFNQSSRSNKDELDSWTRTTSSSSTASSFVPPSELTHSCFAIDSAAKDFKREVSM